MSVAARLGLLSLMFSAPIAVLLWLFVSAELSQLDFSKKELAGASYVAEVWRAMHGGRLDDGGGRFNAQKEVQSFQNAAAGPGRAAAGADLIAAVADGSNLTLDPELDSFYVMDAATVRLPALYSAEAAMAAAAARGDHDGLLLAHSNFTGAAEALQHSLNAAMAKNADGRTRRALAAPAAALAAETAKLDRDANAVLNGFASSLGSAGAFEAQADQTFRAADGELGRLLQGRVARLQNGMLLNLGFVALALLAAASLAVVVTRGLSSRFRVLLGAIDHLGAGRTDIEIGCVDDRNETGRIATALLAFRDGILEQQRLADEAARNRTDAENERARSEAERAETARQQAVVVDAVAQGLARLSSGDLTARLQTAFAPEYEKLRADFNAAMEKLAETLGVIAQAASGMHSGTAEISQAANNLSQRSEQQAASLEETAAALDQITATVRRTAEGAGQARTLVGRARSDAEASGDVVARAVAAMAEIERSAGQIEQIIGVIDEIAFQTNLLALNAGVEAARAGDAGKGFAVVASEVRSLAQRSADAAKEIKALINASTQQVGEGVGLVGETGRSLERIVTQVGDIAGIVTDIAASAAEQATGLAQVNSAVNQMDQVTQQNAAMVEESTAASRHLAQEAQTLTDLVGRFKLGGGGVQARPMEETSSPARNLQQRVAAAVTGRRLAG